VLALTAALVGPYFVDWSSYRADFEREASRILGRDVKVEGTASARLLPFPSVTFTDVKVAGVDPGETAMSIETFSMDAELAPFLSGELLIFDMRLIRPVAHVDIDEQGSLDWAVRPSVPVDAHNISLEKLTVTEGRVEVRHAASGRVHLVTEVNADISARALTGPWRLDGSMRLDGMLTGFAVSTGSLDENGAMRLRVRAEPSRYPLMVEADGSARIDQGRARYDGTFRLTAGASGERLRTGDGGTMALDDGEAPQAPPYRMSGTFDLDHDALRMPEFLFETGDVVDPYTAEGSAEFQLGAEPSFLVTADGAQIRFEDIDPQNPQGIALDRRLAALREFLLDMPKPAIPGRIEVNLPAVVAGDTMVRDVRLHAEPSDGGWHLASLAATLPGRATLEANGDLGVGDTLDFTGSLLLAIGQPSGFAAWLSKDVDEPIRRLPSAGFSAQVELSDEKQLFRDLELVLGAARFRGEIESLTPANAEPSMTLTLDGDALDVEGMAAFASLFVGDGGETRLADRNLSFEITAGPVTAAGLTAQTLDTALRLRNDRLEIDRLSIGGLAGANVSATGVVRNPGLSPSGNLDASVISADLAPLIGMLAERFPGNAVVTEMARRAGSYPDLLTDAAIEFVASAASGDAGPEGVAVSSTGQIGGTRFSLTGSTAGALAGLADTALRLDLTASDEDAGALYALAGLPALPLGFAGGAALELTVDGALVQGAQTTLAVTGDGLDAGFEGQVSLADGALSASGDARLASDDIGPWLTTAGATLPGAEYGLPLQLDAAVDAGDGLLVLSGLGGSVAGAVVEGDINAQLRDGLPHLTGALAISALDLGAVAEMAVGPLALRPGTDGWPDTPFAGAIATPVSTDIEIAATSLTGGDAVSMRDATLALRVGPHGIFVTNLRGQSFGGTVTGHVDFRNDGGTGLLSGQLRLDGGDPVAVLGDIGIAGSADASVSFTASGKSVGGIVTALSGSGTASMDAVRIEGIDPAAFPALIAEADTFGPEIDATAVAGFAPDLVRRGSLSTGPADIAFTLANGIVRAPPLRLEGEGVVLSAEIGADLGEGTLNAEASLTYDAGREALVGSEPTVRLVAAGPPGDIGVFVDTEPLAQFLTQRALELEQQRVEAMQASLLEKQRYRREARYYAALQVQRDSAAEAARLQAEEDERLRRELQLQEEQRRRAEEEARAAVEQARREAEEEARREAEEAERQRLDEEAARAREAEEARQAAERQAEERRQAALREAEERRQAEADRLRAEVEALLNDRPAPPSGGTIERQPLAPPVVDVTPQQAPRPSARQPAAPPPAANVFSEQNLTIERLMRAIGEN
jgi:hypothetical protein